MHLYRLATVILFSLVSVTIGYTQDSTMVKAMVQLDKVYIPALGLSNQPGQIEKAKIAFITFEKAWKAFVGNYQKEPGLDGAWEADLETIGKAVNEARDELFVKKSPAKAHEALEAVREILLEARTRNKISYDLDAITTFHSSMEHLLEKKSPEAIKLSLDHWVLVEGKKGLLEQMEITGKKAEDFKLNWKALGNILKEAQAAQTAKDNKLLGEKLSQVKPLFIKTFFLFGNFAQ